MNRLESSCSVMAKAARSSPIFKNSSAFKTSSEARLAITEQLLSLDDVAECADRALEWLAKHAGVKKSMCMAVDGERKRLFAVGSFGVSFSERQGFSLDL